MNINKILIVEDEEPLAMVLETEFKESGYEVTITSNGEDALTKLREAGFDLIILDLMMPRVNGYGVLMKMQEESINTPVIVFSNYIHSDEDERLKKYSNVKGYFLKADMSIVDLMKEIEEIK